MALKPGKFLGKIRYGKYTGWDAYKIRRKDKIIVIQPTTKRMAEVSLTRQEAENLGLRKKTVAGFV